MLATLAVVAGQVYVGTGYRAMSNSLDAWFDKTMYYDTKDVLRRDASRGKEYYQDDMVIR